LSEASDPVIPAKAGETNGVASFGEMTPRRRQTQWVRSADSAGDLGRLWLRSMKPEFELPGGGLFGFVSVEILPQWQG
jgi:hypothetical protein